MHPFAPDDQTEGYREMIGQLEAWLAEITGFHAVSMMPNAGSQGELTGLLVIRGYQVGISPFLPPSCRHFPRVALLDPRGVRRIAGGREDARVVR